MTKKVYLKSFGCQMNVRDSEVVKGLLVAGGYKLTDDPKRADVVLFNTCSVRKHAEDRVWSAIGNIVKSSLPDKKIIGVVGCMAQNYKEKIFKRAPGVDFVVGPSDIGQIPEIIQKIVHGRQSTVHGESKKICMADMRGRVEEIYHTGFREDKKNAHVVISEGCDNYCTYCVVPYVRGRLCHRPADEIIKEAKSAVKAGIVNITLLGQNVNSYKSPAAGRRPSVNFVSLLKEVAKIKGLKSLSFLTSNPKDTSKELFEVMRDNPIIQKYLHMPLQSGSDKILKAMHRGYTSKKYLKLVDEYRSLVYNGKIGTDVIVGFPGEREADFKKTLELVRSVRFDTAFIFKYSPRPHTQASRMEDDVTEDAKDRRHSQILELQRKMSKVAADRR